MSQKTKLVHEGDLAAEVDVELIQSEGGWSPSISIDDAEKLDKVKDALRRRDVESASKLARVFRLTPIN